MTDAPPETLSLVEPVISLRLLSAVGSVEWVRRAVATSWIVPEIDGRWRSEASWIDRAGRGLGVFWIESALI